MQKVQCRPIECHATHDSAHTKLSNAAEVASCNSADTTPSLSGSDGQADSRSSASDELSSAPAVSATPSVTRGCSAGSRLHDIQLVACFLEFAQISDVDFDTLKLLLRSIRFMRALQYPLEDIAVILAHASVYFIDVTKPVDSMSSSEAGNILVLLMYLAHSYVQDEVCALHVWHKHLFVKYCTLKTLDKAVICLFAMRGYILRVDEETVHIRHAKLMSCVDRRNKER